MGFAGVADSTGTPLMNPVRVVPSHSTRTTSPAVRLGPPVANPVCPPPPRFFWTSSVPAPAVVCRNTYQVGVLLLVPVGNADSAAATPTNDPPR